MIYLYTSMYTQYISMTPDLDSYAVRFALLSLPLFLAFIQFTAEPLASLVDTAYLGRLGPIGESSSDVEKISHAE